ncbi:4-oxalocrotonate tautomerase [Serratia sp. CC22-02]|uniref:tautomerase family protein n=1 Tax=Serratia sp. CC22-02 TaxID=1378076 RepID=UPI002403305A|nr:4-oxalocrotonate tautomerase family protein [Serratia sp. CC22-02]SMP82406.1 4-oxalocrotonate tautomerase [Serratia sp. CC22-02]
MPVVNIQMLDGRDDAKPAIAKAVTDAIATHAKVDPKYIYVIFNDVTPANCAISGEIIAETLKKSP